MSTAVLGALQVLVAGVLVLGGLTKLGATAEFTATLTQLGIKARASRTGSIAIPAIEFSCGTALLAAPNQAWPKWVAGALFFSFFITGGYAIATKKTVECNCLGHLSSRRLGWRQLVAMPPLIAFLAIVERAGIPWSTEVGILSLASILLVMTASLIVKMIPLYKDLKFDRIAFLGLS